MYDHQGALSDEIGMNSSLTFMDHNPGGLPPSGKQYCYSMDRSTDSDYGSELSNIGSPKFEQFSSTGICLHADGSRDSSTSFPTLQSIEVDPGTIAACRAGSELGSTTPHHIDKSVNHEIASSTLLDASNIPKIVSSSSNSTSAVIAVSCDSESPSDERLRTFKHCYTIPRDVSTEEPEFETRNDNCNYKSYVFQSMYKYHQVLPNADFSDSSPTCTEIQVSPEKQGCYSMARSRDPYHGLELSHSRHPEMLGNVSPSDIFPKNEGSHGSPSLFRCLHNLEVHAQISKTGRARSEPRSMMLEVEKSPKSRSTSLDELETRETTLLPQSSKSSSKSCNSKYSRRHKTGKTCNIHPNDFRHDGFQSTKTVCPYENNYFLSTFDHQGKFSDAIVMKSNPKSMNHGVEIQPPPAKICCHSMDRSGNESDLSNSMDPARFENSGVPDIHSNVGGNCDSSSMEVDTQVIRAERARSEPRPMTSSHIEKSLTLGISRSASMDALISLNTVSPENVAMDNDSESPVGERLEMSTNGYTSCNVGHKGSESKITNLKTFSNIEDGHQEKFSDAIVMIHSPTSMNHDVEIQPPPAKNCCYSMDRSANSGNESDLSNSMRSARFENSGVPDIHSNSGGNRDSFSMEVDTQIIRAERARSEPRPMTSSHIEKSLTLGVSRSASMDALISLNTVSPEIVAMYNDSESPVGERLEMSTNGYTSCNVEHKDSESKITNLRTFSNIEDGHQEKFSDAIVMIHSPTSTNHDVEMQSPPAKICCYFVGRSANFGNESDLSNSMRSARFENSGVPDIHSNSGGNRDSFSMEVDTQIIRAERARSEPRPKTSSYIENFLTLGVSRSASMDALVALNTVSPENVAMCNDSESPGGEILEMSTNGYTTCNVGHNGSESTITNLRTFSNLEDDHQEKFSDDIVLISSPTSMNHYVEIQPPPAKICCYFVDRSANSENESDLSNSMRPARFENSGVPDVHSNAGGNHDSSSMEVNTQIIRAERARSEPRPMTSSYIEKSLTLGVSRSASADSLIALNTVSPKNVAMCNDSESPGCKRLEISTSGYTSCNVGHKCSESKITNLKTFSNIEDGKRRSRVNTRAVSEPRSMYATGTKRPAIAKIVSMGSLRNSSTQSLSSMEIVSRCSMPTKTHQSETTSFRSEMITCLSPFPGSISKQSTYFIRSKSEPRSTKTFERKPAITSGVYVDTMVNKTVVRSTSLGMLDSTSLGKSCLSTALRACAVQLQGEDGCTDDCQQTILTLPDIDEMDLQDSTQSLPSAGILEGDEIQRQEEDVKPIIKLEPIDDDCYWDQSIDVPDDELLGHVKEEPSDELHLRNCRVSLETLPFHEIESSARVRSWKTKTAIKKRKVRAKLRSNRKTRRITHKSPPAHKVIAKKFQLKECRVDLDKLPADHICAKKLQLKECRVVLDKLPAVPISGLKKCRVVLEKLTYCKVLCHDFGIRDCRVVLNRLDVSQISSSSSRMKKCSVVLEKLPEHLINNFGYASSGWSEAVSKKLCKSSVLTSMRILTSRLGIKIVP